MSFKTNLENKRWESLCLHSPEVRIEIPHPQPLSLWERGGESNKLLRVRQAQCGAQAGGVRYATPLKLQASRSSKMALACIKTPSSIEREEKGEGKTLHLSAMFALFLLILFYLFVHSPSPTHAQVPIQVGLVVQFAPGNVITKCVTLDKPNPNGWDVLVAANVGVVGSPSGIGMAVCEIGGVGCPPNDCFCKFNSGENLYWSYWHLKNGKWVYSNLGASNYAVSPGEVEGWSWGNERTPPSIFTFNEICAPPSATYTYTPLPTLTLTWTPSPTATFTSTPLPTTAVTSARTFSPTPKPPTSTPVNSPTSSPTTAPPTSLPLAQPSLHTSSLTPSPTITLPFGVLAATTAAPAENLPQPQITAMPEVDIALQSLSLTATAAEVMRQSEDNQRGGQPPKSPALDSLKVAYFTFFAIAFGLLVLLILLVRVRGLS